MSCTCIHVDLRIALTHLSACRKLGLHGDIIWYVHVCMYRPHVHVCLCIIYTYMYIYHGTLQWQIICTYSDICGYVCMYHVYMYVYIDMHVHVPVESVHVLV